MCVVTGIKNLVRCPVCGKRFVVEDIHRPVRCPHCGALLDFPAPDFRPRVLMEAGDMMGDAK